MAGNLPVGFEQLFFFKFKQSSRFVSFVSNRFLPVLLPDASDRRQWHFLPDGSDEQLQLASAVQFLVASPKHSQSERSVKTVS